ncbi:MAG: hypothetical protein L3J83_09510 [Proteobacteria bacterium]|nr:hypothetical protein [Pseudomonadota bacterium]
MENINEIKILIGGAALVELGSSRRTQDLDYLIYDKSSPELFMHFHDIDYINAARSDFYKEIFDLEKGNKIASPQSLLETKANALIQHLQNGYWQKADDAEYDIKYLVRKFKLIGLHILPRYYDQAVIKEVTKIIDSVNQQN